MENASKSCNLTPNSAAETENVEEETHSNKKRK